MHRFETADAVIRYEVHAGLVFRDVLLIHGNLASNRWWQPSVGVWRDLAGSGKGRGGDLILAEWRGCGGSRDRRPAPTLEFDELAGDYLTLLNRLGRSQVDVVGHSTGGLIALLLMLAAPDRIGRAVLLDPVCPKGISLDPTLLGAFDRMRTDRDYCAAVLAGTVRGADAASAVFAPFVDDAYGVAPYLWRAVPEALARCRRLPHLGKLTHEVLVLHGTHDAVLPAVDSRELAAALPRGTFRELTDGGHSYNVESPAAFVRIVEEFLGDDQERIVPEGRDMTPDIPSASTACR